MEAVEKLTAAITMVEEARSVPLSASCVVHRAEMLEVLDEARESLPTDFESAQKIIEANKNNIESKSLFVKKYAEADLKEQKISGTSPIGKGLMGKVVGEVAEIQTPAGVLKFRVDNITV